jgi:hypothetical protein
LAIDLTRSRPGSWLFASTVSSVAEVEGEKVTTRTLFFGFSKRYKRYFTPDAIRPLGRLLFASTPGDNSAIDTKTATTGAMNLLAFENVRAIATTLLAGGKSSRPLGQKIIYSV